MKSKKFLIAILIMLLAGICFSAGGTYPIRHRNVANPKILTRLLQDRIGTLDDEVTALEASQSGIFSNIGTGSVWYVDSGAAADGAGTTWATAFDTLQEGIDAATDLRGDIVYVAQDHTENITNASALVANSPGLTIVGIGNGESQPEIVFITDTTAELTISAADVMIYNIRFTSNIADCATAIQITADGDGAQILGCTFKESSNVLELLKMINAVAAADELVIVGNRFIGTDSADPTNAIYLTGASAKTIIQGNHFIGTWSGPVIDSTTALTTGLMITDNIIVNLDAVAGKTIQVHGSTGGAISGNKCYANGAGFAIVANAMFVSPDNVTMNTENQELRTYEQMFGPFTGATGGAAGTNIFSDIVLLDALLDLIIADFTDYQLDHLTGITTAAVADADLSTWVIDKTILSHLMTVAGDTTTYGASTMSLEALNIDLDAIIVDTGTDIPASFTTITNAIVAMSDTGYVGTCTSNATTTAAVVPLLAGFGNDYFNTGWSMLCILHYDGVGTAPEGEIIDITDYTSSSGTFTLNTAFTQAMTSNDAVMLKRTEDLELDVPTTLGSAGTIRYVDSATGATGDGSGLTWENAYATLELAEAALSAGDVVYIADGHNENLGATATIDVANTSWIGLGEGDGRPLFDYDTGAVELTLNAAGIVLKNLRFRAGATDVVAAIVTGANGDGILIENCEFGEGEGAGEEFRDCVSINADSSHVTVKNCTYFNHGATAADVDTFVNLDATTVADASIIGCNVYGTFAEAIVWWSNAVPTNVLLRNNTFSNMTASTVCIGTTGNATGVCEGNRFYSDTYAAMIDPGNMTCIDNWGTTSIDQQAIRVPISAETTDVTAVEDGSDLERIEYLQELSESALAALNVDATRSAANTEQVWYVDSVSAVGGTGDTWGTSANTIKVAIDAATDSTNAIIFVAPNHAGTIAASVAINCPGVTIIGLGHGENRPKLTFTAAASCLAHSVADVMWKNIIFISGTLDTTAGITLDASSDGAIFEDCVWINTTTIEFVSGITASAAADDVRFTRCRFINDTTDGGANAAITNIAVVCDNWIIEDCYFFGNFAVAAITSDDAETNWIVRNNIAQNNTATQHAIEISSTATGVAYGNKCYANTYGSVSHYGSMKCFDNYETTAINESGYLEPAAPVQDPAVHGTGRVAYVDSGATAGGGRTWFTAVNTLNDAIALCSGDRGDTIYVAAGHTETLGAGTDGVDFDAADITVIGMGVGENRPLFDYDTTTDEVVIGADDIAIYNCQFKANVPTVDHAIDVETGFENFVISGCRFYNETQDTDYFDDVIIVTANSDNGLIENCDFEQGAGAAQSGINTAGADFIHIMNNRFYGDYAVGCIEDATTASVQITIQDNVLFNGTVGGKTGLGTVAAITLHASTTGSIIDNRVITNVAYPELSIVAASCFLSGNTYTEDVASSAGQVIGTRAGETYVATMNADEVTDDLFDVTGGPIMITSLMGLVTADIGAGATSMEITFDADAGYVDHDFSTSVAITSDPAGDRYTFDNTTTEAALTPCTGADGGANNIMGSWFCGEGMIEQFCTADPGGALGAHITWYMTYIPLIDGVVVIPQPDP